MNILITGGTGFVGTKLTEILKKQNHHVFILTRSAENQENQENETYISYDFPAEQLPDIYAVVNLAGASLFGYWSDSKKESIISSRIETTEKVINLIKRMDNRPKVFVSGSAVGFYGMSNEMIFTEATTQPGNDFLAEVATKWERAASQAEKLGIRTVYTRFGVILGKEGSLPLMSLPVKFFAGGKIGSGEQWLSWVHVDDVVNLIIFALNNNAIEGPINVTSPEPKRNKDFMKILSDSLHRPYWFPTPAFLMETTLGEMSQLIINGQYVLPQKALDHDYKFLYPKVKDAFREINSK